MSTTPDDTPTDAELLAAVAEGDPEAFGALYDRHAPWLLLRLRQRAASSDLADQVAQETFLVVWRDARRFRGRGEVGAWIWGIAIRRLLDLQRGCARNWHELWREGRPWTSLTPRWPGMRTASCWPPTARAVWTPQGAGRWR